MLTSFHSTISTVFLLLFLHHFPLLSATHHNHRRILHHPFFPPSSSSPSPSLSPTEPPSPSSSLSPPLPKHPFSDSLPSPPTTPSTSDFSGDNPFFPTYPISPPPPPPPSTSALPTFPANISSLALPSSSSPPSHSPLSSKLIIILVLLSLLTLSLILSLSLLLHRRRRHSKSLPHYPSLKVKPPSPPLSPPKVAKTTTHHHVSHTSSDFLYVGNSLTDSRDFLPSNTAIEVPSTSSEIYLKLCGDSPELRPLPPLPKISSCHVSFEQQTTTHVINKHDDEEFFSPTSFSKKVSFEEDNYGLNSSPARSYSDFQASDSDVSVEIQTLAARTHHFPASAKVGPPAPPPPPPPSAAGVGPPPLVPPSGPVVFKSSGNLGEKRKSGERKSGERKEENVKPKLKALHWDKVRASSDRVMVWDQLKPGSFQ